MFCQYRYQPQYFLEIYFILCVVIWDLRWSVPLQGNRGRSYPEGTREVGNEGRDMFVGEPVVFERGAVSLSIKAPLSGRIAAVLKEKLTQRNVVENKDFWRQEVVPWRIYFLFAGWAGEPHLVYSFFLYFLQCIAGYSFLWSISVIFGDNFWILGFFLYLASGSMLELNYWMTLGGGVNTAGDFELWLLRDFRGRGELTMNCLITWWAQ